MSGNRTQEETVGSDPHLDLFLKGDPQLKENETQLARLAQITELRELAQDFRDHIPTPKTDKDPKLAAKNLITCIKLINLLLDKLYSLCNDYKDSEGKNIKCDADNITYCLMNIFESVKFDENQRAFMAQVSHLISEDLSIYEFDQDSRFADICKGEKQSELIGQYCSRMLPAFNALTRGAYLSLELQAENAPKTEFDHLHLHEEDGNLVYYFKDQRYRITPDENVSMKDIEAISRRFKFLQLYNIPSLALLEKRMSPQEAKAFGAILKQTSERGHTLPAPLPAKLAEKALSPQQLDNLLDGVHDIFSNRLAYLLVGKAQDKIMKQFIPLVVKYDQLVSNVEASNYIFQRLQNIQTKLADLNQKFVKLHNEEQRLQTNMVDRKIPFFDTVKSLKKAEPLRQLSASLLERVSLQEQIENLKERESKLQTVLSRLEQGRDKNQNTESLKDTLDELLVGLSKYQDTPIAEELISRIDTLQERQASQELPSVTRLEADTPSTSSTPRSSTSSSSSFNRRPS